MRNQMLLVSFFFHRHRLTLTHRWQHPESVAASQTWALIGNLYQHIIITSSPPRILLLKKTLISDLVIWGRVEKISGWKNVVIWISKALIEMRTFIYMYSEIFNSHQTVDRVASFLRDTWWEERWLESPASSSPLSLATSSQMGGKYPPCAQPMAVTKVGPR